MTNIKVILSSTSNKLKNAYEQGETSVSKNDGDGSSSVSAVRHSLPTITQKLLNHNSMFRIVIITLHLLSQIPFHTYIPKWKVTIPTPSSPHMPGFRIVTLPQAFLKPILSDAFGSQMTNDILKVCPQANPSDTFIHHNTRTAVGPE